MLAIVERLTILEINNQKQVGPYVLYYTMYYVLPNNINTLFKFLDILKYP